VSKALEAKVAVVKVFIVRNVQVAIMVNFVRWFRCNHEAVADCWYDGSVCIVMRSISLRFVAEASRFLNDC
jgi:hypothetical protein